MQKNLPSLLMTGLGQKRTAGISVPEMRETIKTATLQGHPATAGTLREPYASRWVCSTSSASASGAVVGTGPPGKRPAAAPSFPSVTVPVAVLAQAALGTVHGLPLIAFSSRATGKLWTALLGTAETRRGSLARNLLSGQLA